MIKNKFPSFGLLPCVLGLALFATAQRVVGPISTPPIWKTERPRLGVIGGLGVALSPDGTAVVYMEPPQAGPLYASMVMVELQTGKRTFLWRPDSSVMPSQPSFSPDGRRILFVLQGPTSSYASDIYTIGVDGKGLTKLTQSVPYTDTPGNPADPTNKAYWVGDAYQRYYYQPRYSLDGSRILLHVYDVVGQIRDFTAIMDPDGRNLQVLAEGRPCCWSADGKAVYYTHQGLLTRMDLATHASRTVPLGSLQDRAPIGRMPGREWLAFRLNNGRIGWFNFEPPKRAPEFIGEWSVPPVRMGGQEELALKGFDWSQSSEVLLWYEGEETERFEVVRITNPVSLSP